MPSTGHISVMGSPAASLCSANASPSSSLKPRRFPKHALCVSDSLTIRECLLIISHCGCWKISQLPACSSCYPTSASWLTWPWEFWHNLIPFPSTLFSNALLSWNPTVGLQARAFRLSDTQLLTAYLGSYLFYSRLLSSPCHLWIPIVHMGPHVM